jgi:hypothetical protein
MLSLISPFHVAACVATCVDSCMQHHARRYLEAFGESENTSSYGEIDGEGLYLTLAMHTLSLHIMNQQLFVRRELH